MDQIEKRLCERCFGLLDDMNNWAGPGYLPVAEARWLYPDDETFPQLRELRQARPGSEFDDWTPVVTPCAGIIL